MDDMRISDMLAMQKELWEHNKENWASLDPVNAKDSLLWMMEEMGEVIAIIKKKGEKKIMEDSMIRDEFVTELSDVLMYFNDVLMRYQVMPEEMSSAYTRKHERNMGRNFVAEHDKFLRKP